MLNCDICDKEFLTQASLGGHISGHRRRGEVQARNVKNVYPRKCPLCNFVAEHHYQFGGHRRSHQISFEELRGNGNGTRALRLLQERERKCEICKLTRWNDLEIPIELDHIDGNPDNNVRDNLRLLCPNCHAQQPTHCGKNVGKHVNTSRQIAYQKRVRNSSVHSSTAEQLLHKETVPSSNLGARTAGSPSPV